MDITISQAEYQALLQLKEQNILLRKLLFASRSEQLSKKEKSDLQLDLWDKNLNNAPNEQEDASQEINYKRKKRSQEQNRTHLPDDLERIEEIIEIPEEECTCDHCDSTLKVIGEDISEELEYIPAKLIIKKIIRKKYACPKDSLHGVYRARLPKRVIPKGIAGPQLIAQILTSKYVDHLPLERQEQIFKRLGYRLPKSTMSDWLKFVRQKLDPLLLCLKNKVLDSRILNADETTFKVQQNSKSRAKINGYLWSYIGDQKWVWFDWQPGRGGSGAMKLLQGFTGEYLQSDGYAVYDRIVDELDIDHLACWAHARRKFIEAKDAGFNEALEIITLIAKLYAIEKECKENNLSASEILAKRQNESLIILSKIKESIQILNQNYLPKGALGKACQYTLKRFDELSVYCNDGELEIDNNIVERSIRPVALGRKNWLFAGSEDAASWTAGFYSLIETCKLHKVDPAQYLTQVIYYLGDYEDQDMQTLLPDVYAMKFS